MRVSGFRVQGDKYLNFRTVNYLVLPRHSKNVCIQGIGLRIQGPSIEEDDLGFTKFRVYPKP